MVENCLFKPLKSFKLIKPLKPLANHFSVGEYMMMKKNISLILLAAILPLLCFSQEKNLRYYDHVYQDNIKSVKFHINGLLISMPILELGNEAELLLSFDDLNEEFVDYSYSVIHCDANWQPSGLTEFEYMNGFNDQRIQTFDYSFKAKSIYTHYRLLLPNRDMQFTKSGNYLLKVYENDRDKRLIITRRFMIVDPKVKITARVRRPSTVSKIDTHHEIDFTVNHERFEIRNPQQELSAFVLQNGRWDNAIAEVRPLFSRPEVQRFDYQGKIVFEAGKEFRALNLRGLRYPGPGLRSVEFTENGYEVWLEQDRKRGNMPYFDAFDINGNFIIENMDDGDRRYFERIIANPGDGGNQALRLAFDEVTVHELQSEYVNVFFSLYSPTEYDNEDVFIFGGLTDWQLKEQFRMTYNPAISSYVAKVKLKQGFYDYMYALLPRGGMEPRFDITEGSWHETDNTYSILLYYRPFGGRYDQLIGYRTFNSRFAGDR